MQNEREFIIKNYIEAYNQFDVEGMIKDLDPSIRFIHVSDGIVNIDLKGISAFKDQAEQAVKLFTERKQSIRSFIHQTNETEVEIVYFGILAGDLPNGMKKGGRLNVEGKSLFRFSGDKIIEIMDIS